ncbi:MAG: sodium:calcium antiporter, partial [Agathobacter sp.]|nr:sodium:calcium antiporter [Agathobacter sp.]
NILLVLGIASTISPIGFMMSNAIDIAAVIVATIVCWAVAAKNKALGKVMGAIMVVSYFVYMVYVVMRETGMLM